MSRYRRYKKYHGRSKGLTEQEKFQWMLASVIFVLAFLVYFTINFFSHCIFEWPIRWDVRACWNEQVSPSKEKAVEKAAPFVP